MPKKYQLVIDCADPDSMARFWADALGYVPAEPPPGFTDWKSYWRSVGVPEDELGGDGIDRLVDPDGVAPTIWFQQVPEKKSIKNRLHIDVLVGGGRSVPLETRKQRVDAEAERLVRAGAKRIPQPAVSEGLDHYNAAMLDPEGNEFDIV